MKDIYDKEIGKGDTVCYAHRKGSSTYLSVARVLSVKEKSARVEVIKSSSFAFWGGRKRWNDETGRFNVVRPANTPYRATIRNSNCVYITDPAVKV